MSDLNQIATDAPMGVINFAALQPSALVFSTSSREVMRIERDGKLVLAVEDAPEAAAVLMTEWDRLQRQSNHEKPLLAALEAAVEALAMCTPNTRVGDALQRNAILDGRRTIAAAKATMA